MTHDAAREALEALALDALDASERDAIMAHVAGCATCQSELAALENTAGELALAAAPLAMGPGQRERIRARLVARAAADSGASSVPPLRVDPVRADVTPIGAAPSVRRWRGASTWAAMAASVIALLGVGGYLKARAERDSLRESVQMAAAENGARRVAMDSLRASLEDRDRMIANLTGAQVAVMTLASAGPTAPTGRMFWDQAHDAWTFVAHHVPAPKPGRTYQLWLVTPTAKISAGTFAPSPSGEVMMRATYPLAKDSLAAVAVTDEPGAGSPQPTTAPFLVASK
ncbi:MAG TPA: anti-sigma factor [Gemmatimonadaceae bacterium]|nr:anti-sigma factor [Gemmatimonadaceae bacterium]